MIRNLGDQIRIFLLALLAAVTIAGPTASQAIAAQKRIALTFDDVPNSDGPWLSDDERAARIIAELNKAGVKQAAFFVNPSRLVAAAATTPEEVARAERGRVHVGSYVVAGHVIANHSYSHPALSQVAAGTYLADIDQAQQWLNGRQGFRPWFRYPYLDEGRNDKVKRDAVRVGLKDRGLSNGYATVDGIDWKFESLAADAVKAGKSVDRVALGKLYIETHVEAANFFNGLAIKTLGRSPAHVMLLHENDMAAFYIGDLVRALKADGWTIITADEAFADPISKLSPNTPSAQGTITEMLAWEKGLPAPRWYDRNDEAVLETLFNEQVLHEAASAQ